MSDVNQVIASDGYADGGELYTDEELDIINGTDPREHGYVGYDYAWVLAHWSPEAKAGFLSVDEAWRYVDRHHVVWMNTGYARLRFENGQVVIAPGWQRRELVRS